MLLKPEESCLVLIDMQEKLFPKMHESKALLNNTIDLLTIAKIMHIPTFMTEQNSFALGTTLYDIRELVSGASVVDKTTFSAYRAEAFADRLELLKNEGRTQVIIAGIEEHICVLQTAEEIRDNGFTPFIATDCCSCREVRSKKMAEKRFMTMGIEMLTNEMIAFEWLKDSADAKFKEVLKVIK